MKALPASMVMVRLGGATVPARTSANCATCQSPHRARIEQLILEGYSRPAILRELTAMPPGDSPHPTEKSLRHHTAKHLPIEARSQAAIIERRAEQLGDAAESYGERLADHMVALDSFLSMGFTALAQGEIKITGPDLLKAIDLKDRIERTTGGGVDAEVWRTALMEYMRIAVNYVPLDQRSDFARELSASSVLQALTGDQTTTPALP